MHYLKSLTLCFFLFLSSHSLKVTKGQRSLAQWRQGGPPSPCPHQQLLQTHTPANKHPQLPLTYHSYSHAVYACKAANTQTRTPLLFCSQPSLNSFPCILQLACHSSPQRYQSLSPRPHNGSSWVAAASAAPAISKF